MRKNERGMCVHAELWTPTVMGLCSPCLASAKRGRLASSPSTDTNLLVAPACSSITHSPHSRGWLLCQFPVGMWVPASSRNKAPEKSKCHKKMQNPISKSLSHCSIQILHVIPLICVYLKCVEYSLWKELEALQHQRSLGMHPLSKHTHTPTPLPTPPQAKAPSRENKAACHCSPHFDKIKVYEIEISGIPLKSNGFRLRVSGYLML